MEINDLLLLLITVTTVFTLFYIQKVLSAINVMTDHLCQLIVDMLKIKVYIGLKDNSEQAQTDEDNNDSNNNLNARAV